MDPLRETLPAPCPALLDWSSKLPPFRAVALRLMRLSGRDNLDFRELARLLNSDPAFCADLLRLANSPLFAIRARVDTVFQAATHVGIDGLKRIALTAALRSFLGGAALQGQIGQCWMHSMAASVVAQALAADYGVAADRAYTAAILHDAGRLGLAVTYARDYGELLAREYTCLEENLAAEQAGLGFTHCEAGAALMRAWGFAEDIRQAAGEHHTVAAVLGAVAGLVRQACAWAALLGYPEVRCAEPPPCGRFSPSRAAQAELSALVRERLEGLFP